MTWSRITFSARAAMPFSRPTSFERLARNFESFRKPRTGFPILFHYASLNRNEGRHEDGTNTVAKKGGDGIGYSGHKHQTGEKIIAIVDNNGYVLAPLPVAPANETDTVLLPEGLNTLKRVARLTDLKIDGSYLNLDGGFDSRHNRKAIFNAGLIPNINENPRNGKTPKRGRKRLFNAAIHSLRLCVERTFAWEDKFKRLLLRFEFKQQRHYGLKLMAYTMINLRHFCGA